MEEVTITMDSQKGELSTNNPQSDVWEGPTDTPEYQEWLKAHAKPKHAGGRPCEYCKDKDKIQMVVDDYIKKHRNFGEKASIPFIEELAMILDRDDETIQLWAEKETEGVLEHPELNASIKVLMNIQKLRLKQRTLGRYNPTGAIFQLKANHGLIETEKKVLTGDGNSPLLIELVPEKPKPDDE